MYWNLVHELMYKIECPSISRLRIGILCTYWYFVRALPYSVIESTQIPWELGSRIDTMHRFAAQYEAGSGTPHLSASSPLRGIQRRCGDLAKAFDNKNAIPFRILMRTPRSSVDILFVMTPRSASHLRYNLSKWRE